MNNKIIGVVLACAVGIIIVSTVLVPIISDAKTITGDIIEVSNQNFNAYYSDAENGDTLTLTDTTVSFNGNNIETFTYRGAIYADSFYMYLFGSVSEGRIGFITDNTGLENSFNLSSGRTWTITYNNGSVNVVGVADSQSDLSWTKSDIDWALFISNPTDADYHTIEDLRYSKAYTTDPETQVICSGYYETGENDTFYSYRDGVIKLNQGADYTTSVTFGTELKEGTTDIYDTNITISIGEESFTPFLCLVPGTVTGHSVSGAAVSMLSIIVPFMLVAILAGAVVLVKNRY